MTREDAEEVVAEATNLGNVILQFVYKHTTPDVAIVALTEVVAVVFCNLELEDGVTPEQAIEGWFQSVREDYKEKFAIVQAKLAH